MNQPEDYKYYVTNQRAGQPWSLCGRTYYTQAEVDEFQRRNPHAQFAEVPPGDNIYTREIRRLLEKEVTNGTSTSSP